MNPEHNCIPAMSVLADSGKPSGMAFRALSIAPRAEEWEVREIQGTLSAMLEQLTISQFVGKICRHVPFRFYLRFLGSTDVLHFSKDLCVLSVFCNILSNSNHCKYDADTFCVNAKVLQGSE
jgi:hypothetical protein